LENHFQYDPCVIGVEDQQTHVSPCHLIWKVGDVGTSRRHKIARAPDEASAKLAAQLKRMYLNHK